MKYLLRLSVLSFLVASALGCSDSDPATTPATDAASTSDTGAAADTATTTEDTATAADTAPASDTATTPDTGECNSLAHLGAAVVGTRVIGGAPAMTGGTIADGTYVLTTNASYDGHGAETKTRRRTIKFTGNKVELVNSDDGGPDAHVNYTFTTSGTQIVQTGTCPAGFPGGSLAYTATATTYVTHKKTADDSIVQTYVKQ